MKCELTPPWWNTADAAELDVLIVEFVDGVFEHRERCAVCRDGGPWCAPLREAFEVILDWRRRRRLLSRALWLRASQTLAEFEAVVRAA